MSLLAGMPSPLPTDVDTVLMLNSTAVQRLQVISFFLLGFLLSAAVLAVAWHLLRRDFPALPRLGSATRGRCWPCSSSACCSWWCSP